MLTLHMNLTYISWAAHCSRSDHTARELGGTSHMVYLGALGSRPATVWLKYLGQGVRTWRILSRERPAAVFVMTPPVFAPLVVWLWCATHRARFVLDAHTAAFLHPRWRHFQKLQFWLARRAATTIVHNEHLYRLVEANGAHATIVADVPVIFPSSEAYLLPPGPNVAVVCSFNPDEPVSAIFEGARRTPEIQFHVTGDPRMLDRQLAEALPPNVRLTGFLSDSAYGSLLGNADAVMTLTSRDHTMLRGAWEAVYQGTPVIVSNWPILHDAFSEGTLHVDNTPESIALAVRAICQDGNTYRTGIRALRERKIQRWRAARDALNLRLQHTGTDHRVNS